MTADQLRRARLERAWNQAKTAAKLGVSQPYLALLESGQRRLTPRLQSKARTLFGLGPETLPLPQEGNWSELVSGERFAAELSGMGYPGFAYSGEHARWNPAELLLRALAQQELDARVVEALPWVASHHDLDWNWLFPRLKLLDLQNRFGFLLSVCRRLAEARQQTTRTQNLRDLESRLHQSKLQRLDTFCQSNMTQAERKWLESHSTPDAQDWHLLSDLDMSHVVHF